MLKSIKVNLELALFLELIPTCLGRVGIYFLKFQLLTGLIWTFLPKVQCSIVQTDRTDGIWHPEHVTVNQSES